MKKSLLKELRLSPYASPESMPVVGRGRPVGVVFNTNADDVYSKRSSLVNEEESEEEEIDMNNKDVLELRKRINGKYSLLETLDNVEKELMNEFLDSAAEFAGDVWGSARSAAGHGAKIAANVAKSGIGAIPVLDAVIGSFRIASLASAINDFSDKMSETLKQPKGYFGDMLISESDADFNDMLEDTNHLIQTQPELQEELLILFNEVLERIKELIITIVESYDTIVTAIAALIGTPVASAIAGAGVNIGTFIASLSARSIPFERLLFTGTSAIMSGFKTVLELIFGRSKEKSKYASEIDNALNKDHSNDPNMEHSKEEILKAKQFLNDTAEKGGSVVGALLFSPVDTLDKLGRFYKMLNGDEKYDKMLRAADIALDSLNESKARNKSILFLLEGFDKEEIKEENEEETFQEIDLEEMNTVSSAFSATSQGAGHGGRIGPLGAEDKGSIYDKQKKAMQEQREQIALLQAYHQKTSNRLK